MYTSLLSPRISPTPAPAPAPRSRWWRSLLAFGTALLVSLPAYAANITWGSPTNISGDSDVSTAGTLVVAMNVGNTGVPAATVNGVPFQSFAVPQSTTLPVTVGNVTISTAGAPANSSAPSSSPAAPFSALSPGYQSLLGSMMSTGRDITINVTGLTPGATYAFQYWASASNSFFLPNSSFITVSDGNGNTAQLKYNVSNTVGDLGQYVTGTFVADGPSQNFIGGTTNISRLVNAFQLRQTAPPPDTQTQLPIFTLPEAGSTNIGSVDVAFTLPEAALPGSVTLSFGSNVLTLATSQESAGEHVFSFSPADPTGSSSAIASGGPIANGTYLVTLSYRDVAGNPAASMAVPNVTIGTTSPLVADAVTVATGGARIYPLANDGLGSGAIITSVTNPLVTISPDGRSLLVPASFTGSFDYTTQDGSSFGTGTVNTFAGTPATASRVFSGLLYDQAGDIAGWARLNISSGGSATAQVRSGTEGARASFAFGPTVTTANPTSTLGSLVVTRESDGTITLGLGTANGKLRPRPTTVPAGRHHVALASVDAAIPGGGFLVVNINSKGMVKIAGLLPDGRPLTVGVEVADNGSINFYGMESKGVSPAGVLGGELVPADLPLTDVTGELAWSKPSQAPGSKGTHLGGVDTVLVANGCLYNGVLIPDGAGTLSLSGGNLLADENNSVTISLGKPTVPTGSLRAWASVKASTGRFTPKVLLPGGTRPVVGSGVYLPKSRSAWGYFPGSSVGGRVELIGPALIRN